uniref:RxLR effector candidate protein n=1 Tax=Hyaloperonospora arabidopsidis (strain Emoy2) TaxID=559515 RepID=M4BA12_HYAAE|nr:RxLR effector candidate protein [Hyaloperonospora arabidopsidis Emoy2]BAP69063.1 RxLR effector candidate protein [Hyaloperonospora arabidopsidis Emoy2]
MSTSDRHARVRRMRTLSALLNEDPDKDDELSEEYRALFEHVTKVATTDFESSSIKNAFLCVECQAHESELFCEQCHDYFCALCCGGQHRKGNRLKHTFQPRVPTSEDAVEARGETTGVAMDATRNAVDDFSDENELSGDTSSSEEEENVGSGGQDTIHHSSAALADRAPASTAIAAADCSDEDEPAPRRNVCNLMGHYLLGYPSSLDAVHLTDGHATAASDLAAAEMLERAKYIPMRLTYEERKLLRALEAALCVSSYTDKLDTPTFLPPAKRVRAQLQDVCGFLSALAVASDYKAGQEVLDEKNFAESAEFFQGIFELGRRYKIMNPEKMRGEYGKLIYLLQDAVSPELQELLGFSCLQKIRTVYDVLEAGGALKMLRDSRIQTATMVVAPEDKSRSQIQRQVKQKEQAIRALSDKYESRRLTRNTLQQCLYSIADNNYHLYFERDPIDRMIELLKTHFSPSDEQEDTSLAIVSGNDGARLSHSHARQYNYVLQSLTLWREITHDMFRLWCLTDEDLLADDTRYELTDTGQGLHRIQPATRVSRAMHVILHSTQRDLDSWVGSSVIHLGDKNVPNALMFIDKYTQVGHILRPIVKAIDSIDSLQSIQGYVDTTFGGAPKLKRTILADFFREAFDGSGADNFFEAGSCIDGRLTSAWNWCSNLHKKSFFPIFKIAGFVGFDGKFG